MAPFPRLMVPLATEVGAPRALAAVPPATLFRVATDRVPFTTVTGPLNVLLLPRVRVFAPSLENPNGVTAAGPMGEEYVALPAWVSSPNPPPVGRPGAARAYVPFSRLSTSVWVNWPAPSRRQPRAAMNTPALYDQIQEA